MSTTKKEIPRCFGADGSVERVEVGGELST